MEQDKRTLTDADIDAIFLAVEKRLQLSIGKAVIKAAVWILITTAVTVFTYFKLKA